MKDRKPGAGTWAALRNEHTDENGNCTVLQMQYRYRRQDGTCKVCRLPMTHHDY
jgi:hypothetical protein